MARARACKQAAVRGRSDSANGQSDIGSDGVGFTFRRLNVQPSPSIPDNQPLFHYGSRSASDQNMPEKSGLFKRFQHRLVVRLLHDFRDLLSQHHLVAGIQHQHGPAQQTGQRSIGNGHPEGMSELG